MKPHFKLLYASTLLTLPLLAAEGDGSRETTNEAFREWMDIKRQVTVKELGGSLSISGEIHSEFQKVREIKDGVNQRSPGGTTHLPSNGFDVELDLLVDYRAERAWASAKLKFDNDAGVVSNTKDKIALDRAYFGLKLLDEEVYSVDLEIGRRGRLNNAFDSKIEFDAVFDGILVKYDRSFEGIGDFYIHAAPFVVDETDVEFAYVAETALLNIADTGFYSKYSIIDWDTKHHHSIADQRRFAFVNSQFLVGYVMFPSWLRSSLRFYGAGLYNHVAKGNSVTNGHKDNLGWYVGFTAGEAKKKGDFSLDVNYQWVEPQAVPDFDSGGIRRGNAEKVGTYTTHLNGSGALTTNIDSVGNANFKGFAVEGFYLFTNNLSLFLSWQQSITLKHSVGPGMSYKQFEAEFIYAF